MAEVGAIETPRPVIDASTLRFEISDHRGRPRSLKRRLAVSAVEGHDPDHVGLRSALPQYPKVGYYVTRPDGAAPASGVEGFDLFSSLEPIVANGVKPIW